MCSDPEDENGFCEGSSHVQTHVGHSMVSGNGETHYGNCGRFGQEECHTTTFGPFAPPEYGPPAPAYGNGLIGRQHLHLLLKISLLRILLIVIVELLVV